MLIAATNPSKQFSQICREIAHKLRLSTEQVRRAITEDFYGVNTYTIAGKTYTQPVKEHDDASHDYKTLVQFSLKWAHEKLNLVFSFEVPKVPEAEAA